MRLIMLITGYLPFTFSENPCNVKLVYALQEAGIGVNSTANTEIVLAYQKEWKPLWIPLVQCLNPLFRLHLPFHHQQSL